MELNKEKTVTEKVEIKLTGRDIIAMLQACGHIPDDLENTTTYFTVPGGGNWSRASIEIDDENRVIVYYEHTRKEK